MNSDLALYLAVTDCRRLVAEGISPAAACRAVAIERGLEFMKLMKYVTEAANACHAARLALLGEAGAEAEARRYGRRKEAA